jgi:hypothetical protein
MRRIAVALFTMLFVFPVLAREARRTFKPAADRAIPQFRKLPRDAGRLDRIRAQARVEVGAQAIADNRSSRIVVIPAAGNAPGNKGTYFRSDVTLVNLNEFEQRVMVIWLPNGNPDGADAFITEDPIPAEPPFTYIDFVGDYLGLSGIGALMFVPVTADDDYDSDGALDAYSRIWSPAQDGAAGTFSQPFPGVDLFHLDGNYDALILGLRQDAGYRTNYGIVNMGNVDLPFVVTIFNNEGEVVNEFNVTVRPDEMILRSIPSGAFGNISILVSVDADIAGDDFQWTTFASSTDNNTGDGWVSIGAKPYDDDDLDT